MVKVLSTVKVNGNQLVLSKKSGEYYVQIGKEDEVAMLRKPLKTPGGRKVTDKNVSKYFLQMVEAAKTTKLYSTL
jgi:hypothetical protein